MEHGHSTFVPRLHRGVITCISVCTACKHGQTPFSAYIYSAICRAHVSCARDVKGWTWIPVTVMTSSCCSSSIRTNWYRSISSSLREEYGRGGGGWFGTSGCATGLAGDLSWGCTIYSPARLLLYPARCRRDITRFTRAQAAERPCSTRERPWNRRDAAAVTRDKDAEQSPASVSRAYHG